MRIAILVIAALLAFAVAALALAPARLLHDHVLAPRGVMAERVTGTLWDGQWQGVSWRGHALGELNAGLQPASLLTGQPAIKLSILSEGLSASGQLRLGDGEIHIGDAQGSMVPGRFVTGMEAIGAALAEPVRFTGLNAIFNAQGCVALSGDIESRSLAVFEAQLGAPLPALNGQMECAGRAAGIRFAGDGDALAISGHVRVDPLQAGWSMQARPLDDRLVPVLGALGFRQDGESWTAEGQARF